MVRPTLNTRLISIQNRQPEVEQPPLRPPPPNTIMKRLITNRFNKPLYRPFSPKPGQGSGRPGDGRLPQRTNIQARADPETVIKVTEDNMHPQGMTMQPPRVLPCLHRNIDPPPSNNCCGHGSKSRARNPS